MSRPFNPLPTIPNPIQWDVPGRIAELQAMINNPATDEQQKLNLQAAINLYQTKELPGEFRFIQDGKVVCHKDIDFLRPYWVEGYAQQLSSHVVTPATMPEPSCAPPQPVSKSMFARVRPVLGLLPHVFSIDITMLNDTGSNTMTIFDTDLTALSIPPTYRGFGVNIPVATAVGIVLRQQISVEIQMLDSKGDPVSDWILERAIVTPAATGAARLSGDGIRQRLYFATAPGNQHLYVAEKKNGIVEQLPVV
ncbi:hypothetical protein PRK78_001707 [Emydomyces testavorans]|uniref:Uncharacterized protein n=1 Tax=Emydomyces testavorans TaxID=2070801 RepID=A0AAF0DDA3_9EURO|nr:hypothetical protein PRK78_001707 [Emydomyces testavorans]